MIQITSHMRILLAVRPVDFRKGIDGLCRLCRHELKTDPFSGTLFIFCNRRRTALRVLCYDGYGFWLCHKRLSSGRLRWLKGSDNVAVKALTAFELQMLLWNGDLSRIDVPPPWRDVSPKD